MERIRKVQSIISTIPFFTAPSATTTTGITTVTVFLCHILCISSSEENQFTKTEILADTSALHWIGLSDSHNEGEWKWTDGTELAGYTNRESGQPNDYNNEGSPGIVEGWYSHWSRRYGC